MIKVKSQSRAMAELGEQRWGMDHLMSNFFFFYKIQKCIISYHSIVLSKVSLQLVISHACKSLLVPFSNCEGTKNLLCFVFLSTPFLLQSKILVSFSIHSGSITVPKTQFPAFAHSLRAAQEVARILRQPNRAFAAPKQNEAPSSPMAHLTRSCSPTVQLRPFVD